MAAVIYEVTTDFIDSAIVPDWNRWMAEEHMADVVAAGATSGRILHIETDDGAPRFSVQYEFPSREALDAYFRDHAPRLRDEGTRRFPPDVVRYTRRVAEVLSA